MNVDEAMEAAAGFRADMETRPAWTLFSENVAVVLSFEVKRLRATVENKDAAIEMLANTIDKLQADLAAAKAASVCPVKWKSAEQFFQSGADLGNQWGIELWFENKEQREQFHKWLKERGE